MIERKKKRSRCGEWFLVINKEEVEDFVETIILKKWIHYNDFPHLPIFQKAKEKLGISEKRSLSEQEKKKMLKSILKNEGSLSLICAMEDLVRPTESNDYWIFPTRLAVINKVKRMV